MVLVQLFYCRGESHEFSNQAAVEEALSQLIDLTSMPTQSALAVYVLLIFKVIV